MTAALSAWEASGLARLTGAPGRNARPVGDPAARLDGLLRTVEAAAARLGHTLRLDLGLFTERAAELGLHGRGRISCNGTARMLRTGDGWTAVNLARPDDLDLIEAWIGRPPGPDPWRTLAGYAARMGAEQLVADGRLLGLPVSVVRRPGEVAPAPEPAPLPVRPMAPIRTLRVVDLSALWAGPLCGRLFGDIGAEVIKVESPRRPDAARVGSPRLFERLHRGQQRLALDFDAPDAHQALVGLIERADVVIEASRPRALEQRGVFARELVARRPGLTWISLTAYGRSGEAANWVGFGDDVAASAGLVALDAAGDPVFLGDAIADPISGLTAAREGMRAVAGGGGLVEVSMHAASAAIADAAPFQTRAAA